jgi:ankyrin repeat protein
MPDEVFQKVLRLAARASREELDEMIHKKRNLLSQADEEGNTPLHYGCNNYDNPDIIDLIINKSGKAKVLTMKNNRGEIALHRALKLNNSKAIENLLKYSAQEQLEATDNAGNTALHIVCSYQLVELEDQILSYLNSKQVNVKNNSGKTPLSSACLHGNQNSIYKLINDKSAEVKVFDKYHRTPLHELARNNEILEQNIKQCLELLLEHGASIDEEDNRGASPLYYAILHQNSKLVKLLIERGADIAGLNKVTDINLSSLLENLFSNDDLDTNCMQKIIDAGVEIKNIDLTRISKQAKLNQHSFDMLSRAVAEARKDFDNPEVNKSNAASEETYEHNYHLGEQDIDYDGAED